MISLLHRLRPLLPGAITLVLYLRTACPTVYWYDSGEMTTALWCLGLPHSPSFPFFLLLNKPLLWLPMATIAARSNWVSAVWSAIAVVLLARFGRRLLPRDHAHRLAVDFSALVFGLLPLFWFEGTKAEVYSLNLALILGILLALLAVFPDRRDDPHLRPLLLAAFLFGLGAGNHSLLLAHAFPAFVLVLLQAGSPRRLLRPRPMTGAVSCFLMGASVYLYLPLRSSRPLPIDLGDPERWSNFIRSFTRKSSFNRFLGADPELYLEHLHRYCTRTIDAWGIYAILLMVMGFLIILLRRRRHGLLLATLFTGNVAVSLMNRNYGANPDTTDAYVLLSHLVLTICLAAALGWLLARLRHPLPRRLAVAALAVWSIFLVTPFAGMDLSADTSSSRYAQLTLDSLASDSLLWTGYLGNLHYVLHYVIDVTHYRSDVAFLNRAAVLHWHGYLDTSRERYPYLRFPDLRTGGADLLRYYALAGVRSEEELTRQALYRVLTEVVKDLVRYNLADREVYWIASQDDPNLLNRLIPMGQVMEVSAPLVFVPPARSRLRTTLDLARCRSMLEEFQGMARPCHTVELAAINYIAASATLAMQRNYEDAYRYLHEAALIMHPSADIVARLSLLRELSREPLEDRLRTAPRVTEWTMPAL
ncbi:DUF2723 domain-containing protein [bacterium]|nr:DUF2723 domain-containing protein [candidate division CSSED10-310 bacterium]